MLIDSPRFRPGDREAWGAASALDAAHAGTPAFRRLVDDAEERIAAWAAGRQGYVGVSWGKDSVVTAHLSDCIGWPLVWVRVEPIANPDCIAVRDAYLAMMPYVRYDEVRVDIPLGADGEHHATGTLERGFREAERHGNCHVSGIRGDESAGRKMLMLSSGGVNKRALAPIIRWSGQDVFTYLLAFDLPIHPAYAMSMGGAIPRDRLRVASLGGQRGTGVGRREWEETYYPTS